MRKSTADILAGVSFLVIAFIFLVQFDGEEGISRIFPLGLISFIALGGIWCVVKGIWRRKTEQPAASSSENKTGWKRVGIIAGLSILYGIAIPVLGFFTSTGIFLFTAFYALNTQISNVKIRAGRGLTFAILFSLAIWLSFVKLLNVPTPAGFLF